MRNNKLSVSVIIPAYNAEKTIRRCIRSVIRQFFDSVEILVIDDGSRDSTINSCEGFHDSIRIIKTLHAGVSNARNTGIKEACGEWLIFLDADDELTEHSFDYYLPHIRDDVDAICGAIIRGQSTEKKKKKTIHSFNQEDKHDLINYCLANPTNYLTCHGWIIRKKTCENIKFNSSLQVGEDSDWVLRVLSVCRTVVLVNQEVYRYTISSDSTIHHWQPGLTTKYMNMLSELKQSKISQEKNWPNFILITLLLILTHDVFHPTNPDCYRQRFKNAKELRQKALFSTALKKADLSQFNCYIHATLFCFKYNANLLAWMAIKIRQKQNNRKMTKYGLNGRRIPG